MTTQQEYCLLMYKSNGSVSYCIYEKTNNNLWVVIQSHDESNIGYKSSLSTSLLDLYKNSDDIITDNHFIKMRSTDLQRIKSELLLLLL